MFNLGRATEIKALGKTWTVGRLELSVLEAFRDWVAQQVGDPFALADRYVDKLPPADAVKFINEAKTVKDELASFDLSSPWVQGWMTKNLRGAAKLVYLLLRQHHANVTEDEAFQIVVEAGGQVADAIKTANGDAAPNGEAPAVQAAG